MESVPAARMLAIVMSNDIPTLIPTETSPQHRQRFGRRSTLPVRIFAITLYVCVFLIELWYWNFGWCAPAVSAGSLAGLVAAMLFLTVLELFEQRYIPLRPPLYVALGSLAVRLLIVDAIGHLACGGGFHTFLAFVLPLFAQFYLGSRASVAVAVINIAWYLNWIRWRIFDSQVPSVEAVLDGNVIVEVFIYLIGMVMVVLIGWVLALEERNRRKAEALVAELAQSQAQIAALAAVDERNRIARDIHDSVGHHLMAISIQLEKAQAFRSIDAAEADGAIDDAKRSVQLALGDVRASVSTLRDTNQPYALAPALRALVAGFGRIPIALHINGDEQPFSKASLIALYRVAQEGLTNIEKHSGATQVELRVMFSAEQATLALTDNGRGISATQLNTKADQPDAHFGLTGLRERIELHGGTLIVTSAPNKGVQLQATIPPRSAKS